VSAAYRHAIYWAPPLSHPLWQAGCEWLGRDAADPSRSYVLLPATATPRRYGFHATLKAPLRLRDGLSADALLDAVQRLARRTPAFAMPALSVQTLADFVALRPAVPVDPEHPLRRLADDCVRSVDDFRAPGSAVDPRRAGTQQPALSPGQIELQQRWGYPHVFAYWRFHMSLSDALPDDAALRQQLVVDATSFFAPALDAPLRCDAICVFGEPAPGAPFVLAQRFALEG